MQFLANKEFHCLTDLIFASLPRFPFLFLCSGCGDVLLKLLLVAAVSLMWPVDVALLHVNLYQRQSCQNSKLKHWAFLSDSVLIHEGRKRSLKSKFQEMHERTFLLGVKW